MTEDTHIGGEHGKPEEPASGAGLDEGASGRGLHESASGAGLDASASGAGELIRDALVDDDDPRFPIWLPIPGVALAAGWALYDAAAADGSFLPTLIWPGVAIFLGATLATWLGWQLDID